MTSSLFTIENEVFASYLFYGAIAVLKLVLMSPITITYRVVCDNYMNWEDTKHALMSNNTLEKRKRAMVPNETVNRVRRAHANDIENIVPFVILGLMYVAINPDAVVAVRIFKAFAAARIAHTVIYLLHIPQPARFFAFFVGFGVNVYMAFQVIVTLK